MFIETINDKLFILQQFKKIKKKQKMAITFTERDNKKINVIFLSCDELSISDK